MRYLLTALLGLLTIGFLYSCKKELSQEYGSPAKGSLQSSAGDCLPKTVAGAYIADKSLTDSNYIEVRVDVTTPGPYTISTDTVNGYWFSATGTFANTGSNTVRLKGTGKPAADGIDDFAVRFDATECFVEVTVLPAGSSGGPATYSFTTGTGNACSGGFAASGNYIKDTTLDGRHTVTVEVNVTAPGTYTISTNTVNGYSFTTTGTFANVGKTTVTLQGAGKPVAAGTDNFLVTGGGNTCGFPIQVTAASSSSACPGFAPQGTYVAGTALTSANKVTVTHNYTTAGSYNISTGTVNGYSFAINSFAAVAGANTIVLNATGTPTAAGTNTFTVNFGDGTTCTFTIAATGSTPPTNTDYFPLTQNSWWSYDYDDNSGSVDTFKVTSIGPATISGTVFQKLSYSNGAQGDEFYRKDASNGFYYQNFDTTGLGPQLVFTGAAPFQILFLKNTLSTGASWNSDFAVSVSGMPATLRFKFTCLSSGAATVGGKTFANVYKISQQLQTNLSGTFQDLPNAPAAQFWYARGVGLIYYTDSDPAAPEEQTIRFWQVN